MGPSDLEDYLLEEPFIPVRLILASGDHVLVRHRTEAMVTGVTLFLGRSTNDQRVPGHYRMISIPNIVSVERTPIPPVRRERRGH